MAKSSLTPSRCGCLGALRAIVVPWGVATHMPADVTHVSACLSEPSQPAAAGENATIPELPADGASHALRLPAVVEIPLPMTWIVPLHSIGTKSLTWRIAPPLVPLFLWSSLPPRSHLALWMQTACRLRRTGAGLESRLGVGLGTVSNNME